MTYDAAAYMRAYRLRPANKLKDLARTRTRQGIKDASGVSFGGPCEICQSVVKVLHCDHDHATGLTRGWLCSECNLGLGKFKDNHWLLARAAEYLKERTKP